MTPASKLRRSTPRLTLGVRMALLPALAAAALTLAIEGTGRRGVGVGLAAVIALFTFCVIAVPIDRFGSRVRQRSGTRSARRPSGRRRK